MQKKGNLKFAMALIAIMVIWISGWKEPYLDKVPLSRDEGAIRYFIYFGLISGVAVAGYLGLSNNKEPWLQQTWILVYLVCIIILLVTGITDLYIYPFSRQQKSYIQSFRLFFQGPAPLVIFLIYRQYSQRQKEDNMQLFK